MYFFFNRIKKVSFCILGITLAWVCLFKLNTLIFSYFEKTQFVSWIFLPAGVRLLSVLLFEEYAVMGLFIGSLITSATLGSDLSQCLVISLISALNPYFAVYLSKRLLGIDNLLTQLNAKALIVTALFSASFNCLSHYLYFVFGPLNFTWENCSTMFFGDLLGIFLILLFFNLSLQLIKKNSQ